jgi:hypothetical protein
MGRQNGKKVRKRAVAIRDGHHEQQGQGVKSDNVGNHAELLHQRFCYFIFATTSHNHYLVFQECQRRIITHPLSSLLPHFPSPCSPSTCPISWRPLPMPSRYANANNMRCCISICSFSFFVLPSMALQPNLFCMLHQFHSQFQILEITI